MSNQRITMRYELEGEGPDVVLIHGLGQRLEEWKWQKEDLIKNGYRVLTYDMRGHGESGWSEEEVTIATYADDLNHLLELLSIEKAHLVGLSMGGAVAQAFYRAYPGKVLSLVLAATFSYFAEDIKRVSIESRLAYIDQGKMVELAELIAKRSFTENAPAELIENAKQIIAANDLKAYHASMIASVNADSRDVLAAINVPVLIVVGEGDLTTPLACSEYLHQEIKGSQLVVIPEARHIVTQERAEEFNQALLAFLC
ncbi:alpha/beta fold hydrolase [Brevibacillus sp. SYSU BS000544]|uniref:alpha/beta fold hydrolase n=1 Tax=Brevibacillus sp. SYSU BS000544 TaxID=3416443 RepID=UPI003CE4E6FC